MDDENDGDTHAAATCDAKRLLEFVQFRNKVLSELKTLGLSTESEQAVRKMLKRVLTEIEGV